MSYLSELWLGKYYEPGSDMISASFRSLFRPVSPQDSAMDNSVLFRVFSYLLSSLGDLANYP